MQRYSYLVLFCLIFGVANSFAQQLSNAGFEDWSGNKFDGNEQPAVWNVSNVTQAGFKFNFAHKESGHTGNYSLMVKNQKVGAMGITETSPGYFSLGKPWTYLPSVTKINLATGGTSGGISFKYRPDTLSVWVRRTGDGATREDFNILLYSWKGTTQGNKYMGKGGTCTGYSSTDEESDVRQSLNGNECGTITKGEQVSEGWWREKKEYAQWTNLRIPIYYMTNSVPEKMNIIVAAGSYPNFREQSSMIEGNAIYVDDIELIYSADIQSVYIGDKKWNGFDSQSEEEQIYSLGEAATEIPSIEARRGEGKLTNPRGTSVPFPGRVLSGNEIDIKKGTIDGTPTTLTVKSEDGKKTKTYKIKFVRAASTNSRLASVEVNGKDINEFIMGTFSGANMTYDVTLPYGTTQAPVIAVVGQDDGQTHTITQATSTTGTATVKVVAADKKTTTTYTFRFQVALLDDNTLEGIKVNGDLINNFWPSKTTYRISLPLGTTEMPSVEAISAYPAGEQTITYTAPATIENGTYQIAVTTPGRPLAKVYKLNFKLEPSSYSYLKDLQMEGGYILGFTPENFTYYVNLPLGTKSLPAITYTTGDKYQNVEIRDGGINGTTRVVVTAANGNQTIYKINVVTETSDRTDLSDIKIGGQSLEGFDPNVFSYTYELPVGTTELPLIEPIKGDEYEEITLTTNGVNGTTRISVRAGNGTASIYQITFSVKKATDATLKAIKVNGEILPNYDKNILEYTYKLPRGTKELPEVSYEANDEFQNINVRSGGVNGDYKITVRPQAGSSQTYIIHFSVEVSDNKALSAISIDGQPLENFDENSLEYAYTLAPGVSTLPDVTCTKGDAAQTILQYKEGTNYFIRVTAEDGSFQIYKIAFTIQRSENAFLNNIFLDGVALEGFQKEEFQYSVDLTQKTLPTITVEKGEGQHVVITSPASAGVANIKVYPEVGEPNTYQITFNSSTDASLLLDGIYVNNVPLSDFEPTKFAYNVDYQGDEVIITYDKKENQSVETFLRKDEAYLYVKVDDTYNTYALQLHHQPNSDATLKTISLDNQVFSDYVPTTLNYEINLPAGSAYPSVSYEAGNDKQVITGGYVNDSVMKINVVAQDETTNTYVFTFLRERYSDVTLENLSLQSEFLNEGQNISFEPNKFDYVVEQYDEDAALPQIVYTKKAGQTVLICDVNSREQQVIVTAENGATATYTITYQLSVSSNAQLKKIFLNGVELPNFDPNVFEYTYPLPIDTRVVPCIYPVGMFDNQTITAYMGRVDMTSSITVVAADGVTTNTYKINFPLQKSNNTALEDIYWTGDDAPVELNFSAEKTDYDIVLPRGTTAVPAYTYTKGEDKQKIHFIHRPLGQTSEITVTAENGDERTYTLYFHPAVPTEENVLSAIKIAELNDLALDLTDKTKRDFTVDMPYGSKTFTINYTKNYDEQTVLVQEGGIYHPTVITVKSNRAGESDAVYTITPKVSTQNPAVLTDLKVNNTTISGFDKNRFSYIGNITANNPIVTYTANNNANVVLLETANKHWQAKVTYTDPYGICTSENVYDIWFYYTNDVIPNGEFKQWSGKAKYNNADKPDGWNVLADYFEEYWPTKAGEELAKNGTDKVYLKSKYSGTMCRTVPAFFTLGQITGSFNTSSTFQVSGSITFRNTPDILSINYSLPKVKNNNLIQYELWGSNGYDKKEEKNSTKHSDFRTYNIDLKNINEKVGYPTAMNLTINSYYSFTGALGASTKPFAEMYVDWVRFSYNSSLKSLKANNTDASLNNKAFSVTLSDPEQMGIPQLDFTGEVSDQAQKITWQNPTKGAQYEIRKATIVNYAEDGTSTNYTLEVKRPLYAKTTLKNIVVAGLSDFDPATKEYTCHLTSTQKQLPDIRFVPQSSLQTVTVTFADSTYSAVVKAENGATGTYTVKFVTDLSDDTELETLAPVEEEFNPAVRDYTKECDVLPDIIFAKKMDGQTVEKFEDGTLKVTAEDGTESVYKVVQKLPDENIPATLATIEFDGNQIVGFGEEKFDYNGAKTDAIVTFEWQDVRDSVIFKQTPQNMSLLVLGSTRTDGVKYPQQNEYVYNYVMPKSSNATLRSILVNGVSLEDFQPLIEAYDITTDELVDIAVVKSEDEQSVVITQDISTREYTIVVSPEDANADKKTYRVAKKPELSDNALLKALYVDGKNILTLNADGTQQQTYSMTLPVGEYKVVEPTMPSIAYEKGHESQKVVVSQGKLGEATIIEVTSEDGSAHEEYSITIAAEASHFSDLQNIAINGQPIDEHFEPNRRYYTFITSDDDIALTYDSKDNFQDISEHVANAGSKEVRQVLVTAQDGVTERTYEITIVKNSASNNATLKNILLNDAPLENYHSEMNKLRFDANNNTYTINIPTNEKLPNVLVELSQDEQTVEISEEQELISIAVTAADGVNTNEYKLHFNTVKSSNSNLKNIHINGKELQDFDAEQYYYFIDLPIGETAIPSDVEGIRQEETQSVAINSTQNKTTLTVTAEDGIAKKNYDLLFNFRKSDNNQLAAIYKDGELLENYQKDNYYYTILLPVGTTDFPIISYDTEDEYEEVEENLVTDEEYKRVVQLKVKSQSGLKNTYRVEMQKKLSENNMLQSISINKNALENFDPSHNEYYFNISEAFTSDPEVGWIQSDEYQKVSERFVLDNVDMKTYEKRCEITVEAQNGNSRTYIVHFPIALSQDAQLEMISVGGTPLGNFDEQTFLYKVPLPHNNTTIPAVTVQKKDGQNVDISLDNSALKVDILVTAEDGKATQNYTLQFEKAKSNDALLAGIYIDGEMLQNFQSNDFEYELDIPYGYAEMPVITWTDKNGQTVETSDDEMQFIILVTAENEEEQNEYVITYNYLKNDDSYLKELTIQRAGYAIDDFDKDTLAYAIQHPVGSVKDEFIGLNEVAYELSDPDANCEKTIDEEGTIMLKVTAQNGTFRTYTITQTIILSDDNTLKMIYLNGDSYRDFSPDVTFYQYFVEGGKVAPEIDAEPSYYNAEVSIKQEEIGDTSLIICTAENGEERRYKIAFIASEINDAMKPQANDVLIKRVPGTYSIIVASLRKSVSIGLYDLNGQLVRYVQNIPTLNPNDVIVEKDVNGQDVFLDVVMDSDGMEITLDPNKTYFYTFFEMDKIKIKEGKLGITSK